MPRGLPGAPGRVRGILGLYAMALMEREGPVHGYRVCQQVATRTAGAWRPGAGTIYPALGRLRSRGLVRASSSGRRQLYSITASGRRLLSTVRHRMGRGDPLRPDLTILLADVLGMPDAEELLILRLRRDVRSLEEYLRRPIRRSPGAAQRRRMLAGELLRAGRRLLGGHRRTPVRSRPRRWRSR